MGLALISHGINVALILITVRLVGKIGCKKNWSEDKKWFAYAVLIILFSIINLKS